MYFEPSEKVSVSDLAGGVVGVLDRLAVGVEERVALPSGS